MNTKTALYVCPLVFGLIGHSTSCFVFLAMVDIEHPGEHSDRGGDGAGGTTSCWILYYIDGDCFEQRKSAGSKSSTFVLTRVVQFTIETNALTGTSL